MINYKVCATSANMGIGFDCMGIAFKLYNSFSVEFSDKYRFIGFEDEFANTDNLFVVAYQKACDYKKLKARPLKIKIKTEIPISRGLGSSATLTVGGILAASKLNGNCLNREEIFRIATEIEGHPDNVAPIIYGGLCVISNSEILKIKVSRKWKFSLIVPDFEVKTSEARKVLKNQYERNEAVGNVANAIMAVKALEDFDLNGIRFIMEDRIHEPYRKKLIKDFDKVKEEAMKAGARAVVISGSGSTLLCLSDKDICVKLPQNWRFLPIEIRESGVSL